MDVSKLILQEAARLIAEEIKISLFCCYELALYCYVIKDQHQECVGCKIVYDINIIINKIDEVDCHKNSLH